VKWVRAAGGDRLQISFAARFNLKWLVLPALEYELTALLSPLPALGVAGK